MGKVQVKLVQGSSGNFLNLDIKLCNMRPVKPSE